MRLTERLEMRLRERPWTIQELGMDMQASSGTLHGAIARLKDLGLPVRAERAPRLRRRGENGRDRKRYWIER